MAIKNVSLNELSYDLLEFYRQNTLDTTFIDIRQIIYFIQTTRAKLLKQKLDKDSLFAVDEHFVQELKPNGSPVQMELLDSSIYTGLPTNRFFARTNISIPATIERNGYFHSFTRIGPADQLKETYPILGYDHALLFGNGKFNSNIPCAFIMGDRIVLTGKNIQSINGIKYISIRGLFQNPREVQLLNNPANTDDTDYPINMNMIDDMKNIIINNNFRFNNKVPIDTVPIDQEIVNKQE
jgi:hypothetical protein